MEELISRIEQLELSVRRWRAAALVLGAVLFSFLGLSVDQCVRQRQMTVQVMQREAVARQMVEEARLEAQRQLEAARVPARKGND